MNRVLRTTTGGGQVTVYSGGKCSTLDISYIGGLLLVPTPGYWIMNLKVCSRASRLRIPSAHIRSGWHDVGGVAHTVRAVDSWLT